MQNKTNEVRAKETGDAVLLLQKKTTQELSLKYVIASRSAFFLSSGMKPDTEIFIQNTFDAITARSNEQSAHQQQRKAFTSANKGLIKNR
ncbi:hypothetical protein [Chryseobacterium salviniae]|uniref:Uncharacterized protein n=1 Tax=Chryseobacterium salviniae TaxID=3101750 RepID=A0ABU6HN99_9FLAO|nr:hypothetical protein [Chryseobacterium sp. T9W2-O]MEC3874438.1 hypothetical protein [Chryseobacterium sp. T9W2-O]